MENVEPHRQLSLEDLARYVEVDYMDGDIAFTGNVGYHSRKPVPFRIDAIRMVLCVQGTLQVEINTKEYTLHANDILCCSPNVTIHNCTHSTDLKCNVLALSTRIIRRLIHPGNDIRGKIFHINQNPLLHIGEEGSRVFKEYFELLSSRMQTPESVYRKEIVSSLACAVFYELLATLDKHYIPSDDTLSRQGDILFKRFIELLATSRKKERSVVHYADKLFVTAKYLSTVCKKICGKTAFELINQLVVEDITQLLKYSDKSIKEISNDLDFPNLSFFGKYIKAHTGYSPTEYRRQLSQK